MALSTYSDFDVTDENQRSYQDLLGYTLFSGLKEMDISLFERETTKPRGKRFLAQENTRRQLGCMIAYELRIFCQTHNISIEDFLSDTTLNDKDTQKFLSEGYLTLDITEELKSAATRIAAKAISKNTTSVRSTRRRGNWFVLTGIDFDAEVTLTIETLSQLHRAIEKSNTLASDVTPLSPIQRAALMAALKSMISELEGPLADKRRLQEVAEMLDKGVKEGIKKGVSEAVVDLMSSARDSLFGLLSSSDNSVEIEHLKDIWDAGGLG